MIVLRRGTMIRYGVAAVAASILLVSCGGGAAGGGAKVDAQSALTDLIVEKPSAAQAG